jgi:ATP-dependent protease ClpP protease subunit
VGLIFLNEFNGLTSLFVGALMKKQSSSLTTWEICMIGLCLALMGTAALSVAGKKMRLSTKTPNDVLIYQPIKPEVEQPTPRPNLRNTSEREEPTEVITLSKSNSVVMDQVFTDESVTEVMRQLQAISDKAPKGASIYLVLNTPGGSVDAGLKLVTFAKALPQRIKTVTIFAASMGFQTVQQLDERLILENGTLMSHRARFGVEGQGPGEVQSRLKWIMSIIDSLDKTASKRMGMSFEAYRSLVHDEYWTYDQTAVNDHAADKKVLAKCDKSLQGTRHIKVNTLFGDVDVELSSCPLLPGIISFKAAGEKKKETSIAENYVNLMLTDRANFSREYILTDKYREFQK